jgi:putative ABC transport system permease protein
VAAIVTLALGIGANTAVFSVADALLLRPLPYREPGRLVVVWDQLLKLGLDQFPAPFADYYDYRARNQVFEDIAAFTYAELDMAAALSGESPQHIEAMSISANLFSVLGVTPAIGQPFTAAQNEPGGDDTAILSHALWKTRFGSDPAILGRAVQLNGRSYRIQAVMPDRFGFTLRGGTSPDLWIPMAMPRGVPRTQGMLNLIARLKPGVSLQQAQANLTAIASQIDAAYHPFNGPHGENAGYGVTVIALREQLFGGFRTGVLLLLGAVLFVLLIACANIANLLLARGVRQEREFAIRTALGASRWRILAELATASFVLTFAGTALGALLAVWATTVLPALGNLPQQAAIAINLRVLAFTLAISIATAILFSLVPAFKASRTRLQPCAAIIQRRSSFRNALVAVEVALSVVLLIGAGLLIQSLLHLHQVDAGFNPRNVVSMRVTLPNSRYAEPRERTAFFDRALEAFRKQPGVESAAVVSTLPLSGGGRGGSPFSIEGRPYNPSGRVPQVASYYAASPDYFKTMQIPLISGRTLAAQDSADAPRVAVVNETLARGFWPAGDAIGHRILLGAPRPGAPWLTIAGIVKDIRNSGLRVEPIPQIYVPYAQNPTGSMFAVLRSATDPMAVALATSRQISEIDKQQPVFDVKTMDQRLAMSIGRDRFQTTLLGIFALAALALAIIGIYGVLEHSVSQRIPEIGIRMALGAQRSDVLRLIVRQGMAPAALGMATGLAAALGLNRWLRSLLFGITSTDAATYVSVLALFATVALLACMLPARRASRVDPMIALRYE